MGKLKEVAKDLPNAAPNLLKVGAPGCLETRARRWGPTGTGALGQGQALGPLGARARSATCVKPKLYRRGCC